MKLRFLLNMCIRMSQKNIGIKNTRYLNKYIIVIRIIQKVFLERSIIEMEMLKHTNIISMKI